MVRLPFDGLPLAAALPPLTVLVLLMPTAGHAFELTEEPEAGRSGLRWVADDQPAHRVIPAQRAIADQPVVAAPEAIPVPSPPIPSTSRVTTGAGLVWTAEDEPTPLVVSDPGRDFPKSLTDTRRDLTQTTTAVVDAAQPPLPVASGLRWQMDDEFSALAAANPESSAVELLAAAASRIISVETVVEQLELASPQPGFSPEDIASLLLQAKSPDVTYTDPSPTDSADELMAIDSDIDAGAESKHDLIAIKPDLHSGSGSGSGQIVEIKLSSPQATAPSGPVNRSDVQHYAHIGPSVSVDADILSNRPKLNSRPRFDRLERFSLEPILLPNTADSGVQQLQLPRNSNLNALVVAKPQRVVVDRPVRRASRIAVLGIGLQLLSW